MQQYFIYVTQTDIKITILQQKKSLTIEMAANLNLNLNIRKKKSNKIDSLTLGANILFALSDDVILIQSGNRCLCLNVSINTEHVTHYHNISLGEIK